MFLHIYEKDMDVLELCQTVPEDERLFCSASNSWIFLGQMFAHLFPNILIRID